MELDKPDASAQAYQKAVDHKPDFVKAYLGLGIAYQKMGNNLKAVQAYKTGLGLDPEQAGAYEVLGNLYEEMG